MNVYEQLILSDDYNEDVYKIVSSVYFIVNYSSVFLIVFYNKVIYIQRFQQYTINSYSFVLFF